MAGGQGLATAKDDPSTALPGALPLSSTFHLSVPGPHTEPACWRRGRILCTPSPQPHSLSPRGPLRPEGSAEGSRFRGGAPPSGRSPRPAAVLHQVPPLPIPRSLLQAGLPSPQRPQPSNLCPCWEGALGPRHPPGVQAPSPLLPRTPESETALHPPSWGPGRLDPKSLLCRETQGSGQPAPAL